MYSLKCEFTEDSLYCRGEQAKKKEIIIELTFNKIFVYQVNHNNKNNNWKEKHNFSYADYHKTNNRSISI
jgi:hypothetical protein